MLTPFYRDEMVTLYCGDMREVLPELPPASVDMVFTDPPYLADTMHLYGDLARESARIVKPGGFVYAYCGAEYLPDAFALMTPYLRWFWQFKIRHKQFQPRLWKKRLMVSSKPVLCFTNGDAPRDLKWTRTDFDSDAPSKTFHKWGQGEGFARFHIALRTNEGDTVLEPFAGGGTTLRAAKDLGRKVIACELERANCETIVERLRQEVLPLTA